MVDKISYNDSLDMKDVVYVDTRSPKEFEIDHIPGAVNLPILDNDERAFVGTMYKQVSQEKAIKKGHEIYEKKIDDFQKELSNLSENNMRHLVVYCWRGGMRSKTISELAKKIGIKSSQLNGGYKKFREYVREQLYDFNLIPKLLVLHGLTGSGKTDLLDLFEDKIDLEGFAQHRSSVFGSIGLKPNSQKMFETKLLIQLNKLNDKKFIIVEGESRKVGDVQIPEFFWEAMKKGINIRVECQFNSRVKRLVDIYTSNKADIEKTKAITESLTKRIGKKSVFQMIQYLKNDDLDLFMGAILEKYYDPLYKYSIEELDYAMVIDTDDMDQAKELIVQKFNIS